MSKRKKNRLNPSLQLKEIKPLTDGQQDAFDAYNDGFNLVLYGFAGTGKSYIALYLALKEVLSGKYNKVIIVRSAVTSRDQGFLPGSLEEKSKIFETPYKAIYNHIFSNPNAYNLLKEDHLVEFMTTSYDRGITLDDCVIIVDEAQNMKFEELDTIITRCGSNAKIIFCGDMAQNDLTKTKMDYSGFDKFLDILEGMTEFNFIEFELEDIVRSGLVKSYIIERFNKFSF